MAKAMWGRTATVGRATTARRLKPAATTSTALGVALVVVLHVMASVAWAAPTADEIWGHLMALQANVNDYTAQVRITPQIQDQDNTPKEAKIYVKKPDKVRVDADSVVFIPKDALIPGGIAKHVTDNTRLVLMGSTTENGRLLYGLKAIPKDASGKGADARFKFWVWGDNWTLKRTELWLSDQCVLAAEWWFIPVQDQYWMPYWIVCTFAPGKMAPGMPGGGLTVQFWDYHVNTNLADSIFPVQPTRRHGRH